MGYHDGMIGTGTGSGRGGGGALCAPWRHRGLIAALARRELLGRYRGALLGLLWPLITPLLMLLVYTFVFGVVFQARWPRAGGGGLGQFAMVLLSGLLVHGLLAEVLSRAPGAVVAQPNYVKKVVFPLETLAWVDVAVALAHALAGLALLVVVNGLWGSGFAPAQLALPLILLPYALLLLGLAWVLSSLGVYLRDLGQAVAPAITALMFLGPVFYARESLSAPLAGWLALNPITVIVEQTRRVLFAGLWPEWTALGLYMLAALVVYAVGLAMFNTLKRGFADVV